MCPAVHGSHPQHSSKTLFFACFVKSFGSAELASGQINGQDTITVELIEADETPAVVITTWPAKPIVLHQQHVPSAARTFAAAVVKLAQIKTERKL